jgi:membrane-associated phospholipid phosphatase
VRRPRPDGGKNGFPSAHTSGAFALASVATVYYGPWVGIPSYALASFIGLVRVNALKHNPSDVVAGAVLGTVIGLGTAKFHKHEEFKDYFILPNVSHNSVGVSLYHPF